MVRNKHVLQYNNLLLFRVLLLREIDEHCHKNLFNWKDGNTMKTTEDNKKERKQK